MVWIICIKSLPNVSFVAFYTCIINDDSVALLVSSAALFSRADGGNLSDDQAIVHEGNYSAIELSVHSPCD